MSCGITISDVNALIAAALAANPDNHVVSVAEAAGGWNLVLKDGTSINVPLYSSDSTVTVVGGDVTVNPANTATALCDDADAVATLSACLAGQDSLCAMIVALPTTAPVGG